MNITWNESQANIESRAARGAPVVTAVRVDGVNVRVVISSADLQDHGFPACKNLVERKIRSAIACGLRPQEVEVTVRTGEIAPPTTAAAAAF